MLFYKLKLNLCFLAKGNGPFITDSLRNRRFNNPKLLNFESLIEFSNKKALGRILDYKTIFWRLYQIKYFFRKVRWKCTKNIILLVAESAVFFNLMIFFCKQFNQCYILGWFQGLITNRKMITSYIYRINRAHLYNITNRTPTIAIFIENVSNIVSRAILEIFGDTSSFPITLFHFDDVYISEVHFFTTKSESKVYFYIFFCFSLIFEQLDENANYFYKI